MYLLIDFVNHYIDFVNYYIDFDNTIFDTVTFHNDLIKILLDHKITQDYIDNNVDELGEVPIMMYHGIHNKKNSDTEYTGGNVDKDGYQRTAEAFRNESL